LQEASISLHRNIQFLKAEKRARTILKRPNLFASADRRKKSLKERERGTWLLTSRSGNLCIMEHHQPENVSMDLDPVDEAIMTNDNEDSSNDFREMFDSVDTYFEKRRAQAAEMLTGRLASPLYLSCDYLSLSEYQMLVRKQIELFEANCDDVDTNAQGRNKEITLGQVGLRCRHCSMLPQSERKRGSVYYPAKLDGIYQAAQNMASIHLCEHCQSIPSDLREQLIQFRNDNGGKKASGGGKQHWAEKAKALGVFEDETGLRFEKLNHGNPVSLQQNK